MQHSSSSPRSDPTPTRSRAPSFEIRADVVVGAPLVEGAVVNATLIETRKGEKVKIFKKIRRQGYRRTKGHRQLESVLRVTGLTVGAVKGGGRR